MLKRKSNLIVYTVSNPTSTTVHGTVYVCTLEAGCTSQRHSCGCYIRSAQPQLLSQPDYQHVTHLYRFFLSPSCLLRTSGSGFGCALSLNVFCPAISMSDIISKVSRLKPEIRLAQAVSEFEADLSSEQKNVFRNYRSQSLHSPPDLSDVMRLTAEIDRRASGKVGGRCFGPRFTSFLQVAQQFAALGDIIVGGSQNVIACGVWSLLRMSLLVSGSHILSFSLQ